MGNFRQLGARCFITAMTIAAGVCCAVAFSHVPAGDSLQFFCYLLAALLASPLKVGLPGIDGNLSVNYLFTMLGILELSLPQTLLIGLGGTLVQSYWKAARRPRRVQLLFNLSQVTVSSTAAYAAYHLVSARALHGAAPLALVAAAITHFAYNTTAMSTVIGLTENKPSSKVWSESYAWSFPYYMAAAAVAGLVSFLNRHVGWQSSLLVLPPIYLMYRSYRLYLSRLDDEKRHAQKISRLHLRTIEALALAIGAKDDTTGEHLQRVRVYAVAVARELKLSDDEIEALQAAAVLHDIGKLAVPEHIISKPGKLTPEEFEKMKIHPVVGAEILEQVDFPYPVVPIVRAHHEKWDGSGYPYGLKGEKIPMGARILTAVDCLDALASDRQYRKALPLEDAMAKVASEAGTSFDPRVVRVLEKRYVELEALAKRHPVSSRPRLSTDIKIQRGAAPDAGLAQAATPPASAPSTESDAIRLARREEVDLYDVLRRESEFLRREDVFSLLANRLLRLLPYDALAIYRICGNFVAAEWVDGEYGRQFSGLRIPLGEGLCGWVAENSKPIVNGNPAVEPGFAGRESQSPLCSALAAPLTGTACEVSLVIALYRTNQDGFTPTDLKILAAVVARVAYVLDQMERRSLSASAGR